MNKTQLSEAEAFLAVADRGGFGAAARELGVTQSTVSRRIAALEERVGRRLVERTTRRVALTDDGTSFAADLRDIMLRLSDAQARLHRTGAEPQGTMRITMPTGYGRSRVVPRLAALGARYPKLGFEIDLSDRYVDIIEEGYELAIRIAEPRESGLVCKKIDRFGLTICAAPAYLAARPAPLKPADILEHDCIVQRTYAARTSWRLGWEGGVADLSITPRWTVTDMATARLLAHAGAGIAVLPSYLVADDLGDGTLLSVLPEASLPQVDVFAVYPASRIGRGRIGPVIEALADSA